MSARYLLTIRHPSSRKQNMIRTIFFAIIASIALFLPASGAQSEPSFDCSAAKGSVEKAICADPKLADADRRMAKLYSAAQLSAYGKGVSNQRAAQRDWVQSRNGCAEVNAVGKPDSPEDNPVRNCVLRSYRERNAALAVAIVLDQSDLALASLRIDYPKMAPLYEALVLYMAKPVNENWSMAAHRESQVKAKTLLQPYFADLEKDPDKNYGWSVLSGESQSAEDSLSSDQKMAATLSLLVVYIDNDDSVGGPPFPCAALVKRPEMISAAVPYFGSTLDNFLMRPECEDSLPAQPRLNALHKVLNAFWGDDCDQGTIRFATYRAYAQLVTSARVGLPVGEGKTKRMERRGLSPVYAKTAFAELSDQYQRYRGLNKTEAEKRARYWLGEIVQSAGECDSI
jgi:uncharacterized protein